MLRGKNDYLKWGDQNAICDTCGFKYKLSELQERWDGYLVCQYDWEPQQPLDFQKIPRTERPVADSNPERATTFVDVTYLDTGQDDIPATTFNQTDPIGS